MKKALISALVLIAAATATPVEAALTATPGTAVRISAERTQSGVVVQRSHFLRAAAPLPPPLRQTTPTTPTVSFTATLEATPAVVVTSSLALTGVAPLTASASLVASPAVTATAAATTTAALPAGADDVNYNGVLEGTIIANRADVAIRFFVEGRTFEVSPLRAIGLPLQRDTAVLNLFNCEAAKSDEDAGCFWDPYLLTRDGFYEVVIGQQLGQEIMLSLRAAGAPPSNQIWIQNRTGASETVIVNNDLYEVAPASVEEFTVQADAPVIVQLRSCIESGEQSVCEWAPQGVEAGFYYGLVRNEAAGPNRTRLLTLGLQGIIASDGQAVEAPPQALCRLRVPTLNVRSGPGLEFPIIAKIRGTETEPGSVVVVAFDATQTWMQVTERVARDGWVTSNPEFILCEENVAALPIVGQLVAAAPAPTATAPAEAATTAAVTDAGAPAAPITAAPEAIAAEDAATTAAAPAESADASSEASTETAPAAEATPTEEATPTPQVAEVPDGLARIVVNNGFDQVMRFTLDQRYRPERDNLSGEWDLEPGTSVSILVYPGMVAFSASTAWRGLADNADFFINEKEERVLWLYFVPDPVEKDRWNLQF